MGTKSVLVVGLSTMAIAMALSAPDAGAKEVEWASLTLGYLSGGAAQGGLCTDKPTEAAAEACSQKTFRDAGGGKVVLTRSWRCKGWIAAAIASSGASGVAWCKPSLKEAEVEALAVCMKKAPGKDDCKVVFKKADLL